MFKSHKDLAYIFCLELADNSPYAAQLRKACELVYKEWSNEGFPSRALRDEKVAEEVAKKLCSGYGLSEYFDSLHSCIKTLKRNLWISSQVENIKDAIKELKWLIKFLKEL
mgnify:CR=1 FL=1